MLPAFGSRVYVPAAVHQPNDANAPCPRPDDPRLYVQIYRLCSKNAVFQASATAHTNAAQRGNAPKGNGNFLRKRQNREMNLYFEISTPPVAPRIYGIVSYVTQGSSEGLAYSLDITVDGELTSSQGSDHEKTSTETTKAAP
jgi:hypothetical protein